EERHAWPQVQDDGHGRDETAPREEVDHLRAGAEPEQARGPDEGLECPRKRLVQLREKFGERRNAMRADQRLALADYPRKDEEVNDADGAQDNPSRPQIGGGAPRPQKSLTCRQARCARLRSLAGPGAEGAGASVPAGVVADPAVGCGRGLAMRAGLSLLVASA